MHPPRSSGSAGSRKSVAARRRRPAVDIVIPIYNEAEVFEQTYRAIRNVVDSLRFRFVMYCVDDGSTDGTADVLRRLAARDAAIRIIQLSRNFGHQAALTAGLSAAQGDIVVTMDADGQHPPELIPKLLSLVRQGYDIVQAQRVAAVEADALKKWTSGGFYRLLNLISGTPVLPGAADFRALSRQAVDALNSMPEYHRFLRGMISWMGFPSATITYTEPRRTAGRSKYSFAKMFRLAMDALFSFSLAPLYLGLTLGGILLCLALVEMAYVLSFWVTGRTSGLAPGWSSLMFVILIVGGMLMVLLGFVGVYVGYIFQEVKRRPVFITRAPERSE
jgi:glycosyltransferase involved in cell wall biosynthesis